MVSLRAMESRRVQILGQFPDQAMLSGAHHRAQLLGLDLRVQEESQSRLDLMLSGQPALVDAFEVACLLGEGRSIVDEVRGASSGQGWSRAA